MNTNTRIPEDVPGNEPTARLESLFDDARGELLGTLYYVVGNMEDARDALQEAFLKCWRNQDQIESIDNLRAWVFRIALNTGRDIRKTAWKRRREALSEDELMVAQTQSPESGLIQQEQLERLRQAVHRLKPEEQEVFLLRQNGDMTYEQIAQATGMPLGTVKTRMRAALGRLRESMGGES